MTNNNKPKVSIVMSSYNHERFIEKCIESVIHQTFQDWEFIIFDDCSTDNTYQIAKKYENKKIKVYKSPYNRGMVQNNNEAIKLSKGQYVSHLNSDDFWDSAKLEKQVGFLDKNSTYAAVFTDINLINEQDKIISDTNFTSFRKKFVTESRDRFQWLNYWFYYGNCLCYTSSLIRKECFNKIGLYNPAYIVLLDFDMWIRICMAGYEIYVLQEKLTNFRLLNKDKNLGKSQNKFLSYVETGNVINNYLNIKNKDEFSRIFPEYNKDKLKNNEMKYCLADLIIEQILSDSRKIEEKYLRRLRDHFLISFLFDEINRDPQTLDILQRNFSFDFRKYTSLSISPSLCSSNFTSKKKKLVKFLLKSYIVVSLIAIIYFITSL